MKARESGMPAEAEWNRFFDVEGCLRAFLGHAPRVAGVVEFGCGYGTFTMPLARWSVGRVVALDIEQEMIEEVERKALFENASNIDVRQRDFVASGTGLPDAGQTDAIVFNLLHLEAPLALLREARRVLKTDGRISVMHWRTDIETPRGPPMTIRPSQEQCGRWLVEAGFREIRPVDLSGCCPYHYGISAVR